jgi:hypothetical protein
MTDLTSNTDKNLDYCFLLVTHMVCADQQIHNKELKYLNVLEEKTKIGQRTKEEKEKIFTQDENLMSVDVIAQRILSKHRCWVMREILLMAYIDGFYSSSEHKIVEQVGQIWGWSVEKMQIIQHLGQIWSLSHEKIHKFIKYNSNSRDSLWDSPEYKAAIDRCTKIAKQDFKFTSSALQTSEIILENLKARIEQSLETIQNQTSENAKAETAKEVIKLLKETKQSLDLEIIKKIQKIGESLNAKQRTLNYFSIAFIGKTKVGKSTLHAIMTGEGWDSIGVGKQRTTRLNRVYEWENIRIIDTPGIGAPGGKTDEEIAQSVINEADVICFVVTNDSIQETEFKFLHLLKESAKPLIVLLNVHKNFRDSRRGSYELDKFINNPDKLFALDGASGLGGHIERIRRYAQQHYGNDYFDIVPVMLLAAQLSSEAEYQDSQEQLFQASQIQKFLNEIRQSIVNYGEIRRSQTLLGCTAVELEKPYQWVKSQAEIYKNSTEQLQKKHQSIRKEIGQAANDAQNSLKNEIESIFKDALNAIPSFAESHWNSSETTMQSAWQQKLKNIHFEERLNTAYKEIVNNFAKEVQESLEEIGRELQLSTKFNNLSFSFDEQDKSDERNFFRIGGGILGLAGVVMGFIPPLAAIGFIVGIVGGITGFISNFFKSKQEKRREAVINISNLLESQIKEAHKNTLSKVLEQLNETCDEVKVNINYYFKELIGGLDEIAQNLNSAQSELFDQSVDSLNRAYAKRLFDWCNNKYEPLTQDCIDAVISQVTIDSEKTIHIDTKANIELKRDVEEIQKIIQQNIVFKQANQSLQPYSQPDKLLMSTLFKSVLNFFVQCQQNRQSMK